MKRPTINQHLPTSDPVSFVLRLFRTKGTVMRSRRHLPSIAITNGLLGLSLTTENIFSVLMQHLANAKSSHPLAFRTFFGKKTYYKGLKQNLDEAKGYNLKQKKHEP